MWTRLKALWGGRIPRLSPDAEEAAPAPRDPVVDAERAMRRAAIEAAGKALDAGELGDAMARIRELLVGPRLDGAACKLAARLMAEVGEDGLAERFLGAAEGGVEPLLELATGFLAMDDAPMASAMARAAHARAGRGGEGTLTLLVEATARTGDHAAVVSLLGGDEAATLADAGLARRYGLSAALDGQHPVAEKARDALADSDWARRAIERAAAFEPDADAPLRHALFVEYGSVLLEPTQVLSEGLVGAVLLARLVRRAREALRLAQIPIDRVAYASSRGEVFAHWLAKELDSTPMPLSARITGQRLLVVAADDHDLEVVVVHAGYGPEPVVLLQLLKDPRRAGPPAADLVGVLGAGTGLPLQALDAPKAADRLPPRLVASGLMEQAERGGLSDDGAWPDLARWVEARRPWLAVADPAEPEARPTWLADLPDWARGGGPPGGAEDEDADEPVSESGP